MSPVAVAAAFVLIATASASTPPVLSGEYVFPASARKGGEPVCPAPWTIAHPGPPVESGAEVVRQSFRIEVDGDDLTWLVRTLIDTNGQPDCSGSRAIAAPGPFKETRTYVLMRKSGSFAVCPAPTRMPNGALYTTDCWGEATPVR